MAPEAYLDLPGGPEAVAARQALVAAMVQKGPRILRVREKQKSLQQQQQAGGAADGITGTTAPVSESSLRLNRSASTQTTSTENGEELGYVNYAHHHSRSDSIVIPPMEQEMSRAVVGSRVYGPSGRLVPTLSRASSF